MRIVVVGYGKGGPQEGGKNNVVILLKELARQQSLEVIEALDGSAVKAKLLPKAFVLFYFHRYKSQLLVKWLYEVKLPSLMKKIKGDVVISLNGCCSKTLEAQQVMFLSDADHLREDKKKRSAAENYSFKNIGLFLNRAALSIVDSAATKKYIEGEYGIKGEKVEVVYPSVAASFKAAPTEMRERTKEKYGGGKEYFLSFCDVDVAVFVNILKAFSVFKKWQQSNMKLLLVYFKEDKKNVLQEKLASYKYRSDVHLIHVKDEVEYAALLSSAYAMVYFAGVETEEMKTERALRCGVPVISVEKEGAKESSEGGVLYVEDNEPQSFGKGMIQLYKDEKLRNEMVQTALLESAKYDIEKNASMLWLALSSAVVKPD